MVGWQRENDMAARDPQNFDNHVMIPKGLIKVALPIFIGVICSVVGLFMVKSIAGLCLIGTGTVLVGGGAIAGLALCRGYCTKLQDRIIRMEMGIRLEKLLPADLRSAIPNLTIPQLVGLRFASDAEMPDLVRKVVADNIEDRKVIKKMVSDWQGDYDRV